VLGLGLGEASGVVGDLVVSDVEAVHEFAHGEFAEGFEATFGEILVVIFDGVATKGFLETATEVFAKLLSELPDTHKRIILEFGWIGD